MFYKAPKLHFSAPHFHLAEPSNEYVGPFDFSCSWMARAGLVSVFRLQSSPCCPLYCCMPFVVSQYRYATCTYLWWPSSAGVLAVCGQRAGSVRAVCGRCAGSVWAVHAWAGNLCVFICVSEVPSRDVALHLGAKARRGTRRWEVPDGVYM